MNASNSPTSRSVLIHASRLKGAVTSSSYRRPLSRVSDSLDLDCLALALLNRQDAVQPGDLEQLHQRRPHAAEYEAGVLQLRQLLVEREHDADRLAREVLDPLEVEDQVAVVLLVHEAVQLRAD